ncbi:MAG: ATP-binding protein [Candidatus Krumholzibacteria bacterium]|nr:ATP-binding protein [Candidatus Krumholzibacteria bacterium]
MGNLTLRGSFERPRTLRAFLGLRMMVLALIVGAGIMIAQLSQDEFSAAPLYLLLVLSYLVGGMFYAALHLGLRTIAGIWLLMIVDIVLETAIVHYSGGVTSQFSLIFCLSIIAAAFLLQVPGGLGIALLASLCYICYGLFESKGLVVPPGATAEPQELSAYGFLQTYMHVSLFFLVGAVAGYLAERMRLKGRQLENAKTELRRLRIDTDNILKHMSSGVLVIDSEGKILTINPVAEQILGFGKKDIRSMDIRDTFDSLMPEFTDELVRALQSDESKHRQELSVTRPGRQSLPLGISISQLKDDDDNKRGIIAVFQDLTEVRDMQDRVRKADRLAAIGELSAGIAHEIRNPLASISGSIEMLSHEIRVDGENKRLMELIVKESDRLDRIINDFLEFARLRQPAIADVSIEMCLGEVAVLLKNNASINCHIVTKVHEQCRDVLVRLDEEQMKQVFLNLGINACEAMPNGGQLTIEAAILPNRSLRIAFADQGAGITEDTRSRLFEPFFTTKNGGTGLGLALANKIVEAHAGRIDVRNREQGGAEFAVIVPRSALLKRTNEYGNMSSVK